MKPGSEQDAPGSPTSPRSRRRAGICHVSNSFKLTYFRTAWGLRPVACSEQWPQAGPPLSRRDRVKSPNLSPCIFSTLCTRFVMGGRSQQRLPNESDVIPVGAWESRYPCALARGSSTEALDRYNPISTPYFVRFPGTHDVHVEQPQAAARPARPFWKLTARQVTLEFYREVTSIPLGQTC